MKVEVNSKSDLFGQIIVTISKKGLYYSAEVYSEQEALEYIKTKLTRIAADTVRKMYEQKVFFFANGRYNTAQLLAFQALKEALNNELSISYIRSYILPILNDLQPHKTASHYKLFNDRYNWLLSLCFNLSFNQNASELRQKYFYDPERPEIIAA